MNIRFDQSGFSFDPFGQKEEFHREQYRTEPKPARSPLAAAIPALPLTLIFGAVWFYVRIPAINIQSGSFWSMLALLCLVYTALFALFGGFRTGEAETIGSCIKKRAKLPACLILLIILITVIGSAAGWVLFRASAYAKLLPFESGDFASEVEEVQWDQIPMLDSASANTLATRKLGELSDLVSQFEVDSNSAQINYQDTPVRVTYLNYGDVIKWWKNKSDGIPAYIVTDMQTQAVSVVRLEDGIRYSPSELFNRDIDRHLRFCFPTALFGDVNFEIDEDGTPWWVASVEKKTIGLFGGTDVKGAVLCNAITGEATYYDVADVPSWVDRVYDADLLTEQYNYYGMYHNGFINSIFGQTECTVTTTGYNYIAMDDDVWLYTGITSVGGDESNIGFILVNQRTKQASYYSCAGAEEYSGMASAEGAVQQYSYTATFPLLLNIGGEPTYFMALKDASQLVKMYAMVNVHEYQIVATGSNVEACLANYQTLLVENGILTEADTQPSETEKETPLQELNGTITDIRQTVIDGNTLLYFELDSQGVYYAITAADAPEAVLLNTGDQVTVTFATETDGTLVYIDSIAPAEDTEEEPARAETE